MKGLHALGFILCLYGLIASPLVFSADGNEPTVTANEIPITKQTVPESKPDILAGLRTSAPSTVNPIDDGAVGKMFFGLGAVLALIFLCSWLLKHFNVNKRGSESALSISGVLPIGTKEKVVVVNVEGTRLVLGVTPTHVSKLHTLSTENNQEPNASLVKDESVDASFSTKMRQILKEGANGAKHAD